MGDLLRLNLGCSDHHLPSPFINVDRVPPADQIVDLDNQYPLPNGSYWPWDDSSVSIVIAHDILEHLHSKIRTMHEIHRVLCPGGTLDLWVPTTDGRGAFQDPTHVSWWTPNDLFYFCEEYPEWQRFHAAYGITARFKVEMQEHRKYPDEVWKLRAVLKAMK